MIHFEAIAAYTLHNTKVGDNILALTNSDSEISFGSKIAIGFALATFAFIYIASRMMKRDVEKFSNPPAEESKPTQWSEAKSVPRFIKVLPSSGQAVSRPTRFFRNGISALDQPAPKEDKGFYE